MRTLEPGLTLRSYRLEHRIGQGGNGEVWLATDNHGTQVALKARVREASAEDQRFRREFERLRTLRLPGVVRVLDTGADQGYIFFTMELAKGVPFDGHVSTGRSLKERVQRVSEAGAAVARAIACIHRLHLAHRDIKPANILVAEDLLERDVRITLLDFGTHRFGAARDESGEFMGTVAYMAPEQRLNLPHDHRVDCYALGVTLHEALSSIPAARHIPGRRRRSLALLGPEVPLSLAHIIDRLLKLDPAARPSAEEADEVLTAIAQGTTLTPAPWPVSTKVVDDPKPLLDANGIVVGSLGTARRRVIEEARWHWYRKGYRSFAGHCTTDRPFSAWTEILAELFREQDPVKRRELAGDEAPLLHTIWPDLPVPVTSHERWPPDPVAVGRALTTVLARRAPLAVCIFDVDCADPGTSAVLASVVRSADERIRIWCTSRRPFQEITTIPAPPWGPEQDAAVEAELLPEDVVGEGPPGTRAIEGMARAWRALARRRPELGPAAVITPAMVRLSVLAEPFPRIVALQLTPDVDRLVNDGHLRHTGKPEAGEMRLAFSDAGTRAMASAQQGDLNALHAAAAEAWCVRLPDEEAVLQRATHAVATGRPDPTILTAAIQVELDRGRPSEVDRWLNLKELVCRDDPAAESEPNAFLLAYARLYATLELNPNQVDPADLRELAANAANVHHRGLAAYLRLIHETRVGDSNRVAVEGRRWARDLAPGFPRLAASMLREIALAHMGNGHMQRAISNCREALTLARRAAMKDVTTGEPESEPTQPIDDFPLRLTQSEVNAATTLSAALVYDGQLVEASKFCAEMAQRCQDASMARGAAAFYANGSIAQLYAGDRKGSADALAQCRALQPQHRDPVVMANCATVEARLAIERGDQLSGRLIIDEAITAAQALGDGELLGEAWSVALEAAVQSADAAEAQRALATYGLANIGSERDHWPAVIGRWRWLVGDLDGALQATAEARSGYGSFCVRAEHSRLLLVQGRYDDAGETAEALREDARYAGMKEIVTFAELVSVAAGAVSDAVFTPLITQTRSSRWVHLYLGALHLDAIRRRLRGENVRAVLRELWARGSDVGHALYRALAQSRGW